MFSGRSKGKFLIIGNGKECHRVLSVGTGKPSWELCALYTCEPPGCYGGCYLISFSLATKSYNLTWGKKKGKGPY